MSQSKNNAKKFDLVNAVSKSRIIEAEQGRSEEDSRLLSLWQKEIENLSTVVFDTYEDAMNTLIDNVLNRFPQGPDEGRAAKSFLREFLNSDPAVEAEIRAVISCKH